jgi:glycosyltransferase involved in cell wall biosynthesis
MIGQVPVEDDSGDRLRRHQPPRLVSVDASNSQKAGAEVGGLRGDYLTTPLVAVNGRFLTMSITGVQRYAHEILARVRPYLGSELRIIVPPSRVLEEDELDSVAATSKWHGLDGHFWEQIALPRLARKAGAHALWSPCNWGPVSVRRQIPVIHDIAPITLPQHFTPPYRALARTLTRPLVRRSALVVTPSSRVRHELLARYELEPDHVQIVPPGVGEPFVSFPLEGLASRRADYCLLVGAHAARKNAQFLIDLWPEVHARTNLELRITYRRIVTTRRPPALERARAAGVVLYEDPTDEELLDLYANAMCLLWPSHYEGFGFPLLEAMAVGTPFLSTDVGAAAELAVIPDEQILPLEPDRWCERLEAWQAKDLSDLREISAREARVHTWEAAAEKTARVLDDLATQAAS